MSTVHLEPNATRFTIPFPDEIHPDHFRTGTDEEVKFTPHQHMQSVFKTKIRRNILQEDRALLIAAIFQHNAALQAQGHAHSHRVQRRKRSDLPKVHFNSLIRYPEP